MSEMNSSVPFKQYARPISKGKDYVFTDFLLDCIQIITDPAQTEAQKDDNDD
jgi:hypothetical protein